MAEPDYEKKKKEEIEKYNLQKKYEGEKRRSEMLKRITRTI